MTTLREAAQQALKEIETYGGYLPSFVWMGIRDSLRAALAEPERKPLNEEQVDRAYQEIWRTSPDDFGPTAGDWIEAGIRYAERAHGIIEPGVKEDK